MSSDMSVSVPEGADTWIRDFLQEAQQKTEIVRESGAVEAAAVRDALLGDFIGHLRAFYAELITVKEAALILGRDPETVRRKIRRGVIRDTRTNKKQHIMITRLDALAMMRSSMPSYDPQHDAINMVFRQKAS